MYSERLNDTKTVKEVLKNLCTDTKKELIKIFGDNYFSEVYQKIQATEIFVIRLKKTNEAVGLFGLIELKKSSTAGIYLLTTDKLHSGNIITFLKGAKKQINLWSKQYNLIMDNLYKKNETIKKWLVLLGFKPSQYQNDDFQIYYKGDINEYN